MTKILVIEDERPLLHEVMDLLGFEGYDVYGASDGVEGVRAAQQYSPDLIVCDILMPRLDGYGVLLQLRHDPATASIPFIFLTAKASREDWRFGMEQGADDYLTKPFTSEELLKAIHTRLQKHAEAQHKHNEELDELRSYMITALPHELRTPLVGILGFGEYLSYNCEVLPASEIGKIANMIVASGQRLNRLVENYLLYAQLEVLRTDAARTAELRSLVQTDPGTIIAATAHLKARQWNREPDLILETYNDPVKVSYDGIRKIAEELIDNAFKFSSAGMPIKVVTSTNMDRYCLQVSNRGRGMTAQQIQQVGTAYAQFDRKLHEQQGVGLGLALAVRITELHNGLLTIASEPDGETCISVDLPLAVSTEVMGMPVGVQQAG
ncbi:MAG: response regulator [Anaerolineae bacterium]|nr:response regulator [Anaerolineae bacterium]